MKVNSKILSIPPYISSSWENISSLHIENKGDMKTLVIHLVQGAKLEIPGLNPSSLFQIFQSHEQYLEETQKAQGEKAPDSSFSFGIPLTLSSEGFQQLIELLQDPHQPSSIEFPDKLIEKVFEMMKSAGLDKKWVEAEGELLNHPLYEQLKKMFEGDKNEGQDLNLVEEEISDDDLRFKDWDIQQISKQLYKVTNPLDLNEEYQVYLGSPIGCTCGHLNCEHIKSVLKS